MTRSRSNHENLLQESDVFDETASDLSPGTLRAYRAAWRDFVGWCKGRGRRVLPVRPETLIAYFEDRNELSRSALDTRRSAIAYVHERVGHENPIRHRRFENWWAGFYDALKKGWKRSDPMALYRPREIIEESPRLLRMRNRETTLPTGEKKSDGEEAGADEPILGDPVMDDPYVRRYECSAYQTLTETQKKLIPAPSTDLGALRDRAMLLLLTVGEISRAAVLRIRVEDARVEEGECTGEERLEVLTRKRSGAPDQVLVFPKEEEIDVCTLRAVTAWIVAADLWEGPLFRAVNRYDQVADRGLSTQSVNLIVKRRASEAGYDPAEWTVRRLRHGG